MLGRRDDERVFFIVHPEGVNGYGRLDEEVACTLDSWLGDDLVRVHPLLLVTRSLARALEAARGWSGFGVEPVRASGSPFFRNHNPGRTLPEFRALRVYGQAGNDDMGLVPDGSLVVSLRVLECLSRYSMRHATLTQYIGAGRPRLMERLAARWHRRHA